MLVGLLMPLVLLAGCAQGTGGPPMPTVHPLAQYGPDDLVLRVKHYAGFAPPDWDFSAVPVVAVYGDGRVITQGPVDASYPPPALPNLLVARISAQDVARLVTLAIDAGVGAGLDYGNPEVVDAGSTGFVVLTDRGELRTTVYALQATSGLSAGPKQARQHLIDLYEQLIDLPSTLGPGAIQDEHPYDFRTLAVRTRPWPAEVPTDRPQVAWPGPALTQSTCTLISGADLAPVRSAAAGARSYTPWVWDGELYEVIFRPMLPDETRCDDIEDRW